MSLAILGKQFFNCGCKVCWIRGRRKTLNGGAIWADQKFSEVPLNSGTQHRVRVLFDELENWVGVGAVNIDFGRTGKAHLERC